METITDIQSKEFQATPTHERKVGDWYFVPISMFTPKDDTAIQEAITTQLDNDAKQGKGLFANETKIQKEDEFLDNYLRIKPYDCDGVLSEYYRDLQEYGVMALLNTFTINHKEITNGIRLLFCTLNECADTIKDNTESPNKTRNALNEVITQFDDVPIWGLFFQILILQGLCDMLENMDIEGKPYFDEIIALANWLMEALSEKELLFCYQCYGDEDLKTLKPLCDYLCTTEVGKLIQDHIKESYYPKPQQGVPIGKNKLPEDLNNDKAEGLFNRLVEAGFCLADYSWNSEKTECQAALCAHHISIILWEKNRWKPFEILWGKSNMAQTYNRASIDANQQSLKEIDELFPENKPQKV